MVIKSKLKSSLSILDFTPFVDVVFLMLLFFLVHTETLAQRSLSLQLPKTEKISPVCSTPNWLFMDQSGVLFLGKKKQLISKKELENLMEQKSLFEGRQLAGNSVTFCVDERTYYGEVLNILQTLQKGECQVNLAYRDYDAAN